MGPISTTRMRKEPQALCLTMTRGKHQNLCKCLASRNVLVGMNSSIITNWWVQR
uniref:Uncharacterized protein n=1 Tax=Anguilla anguilla TaxID=7936 RepID=A0A0E9RXC9_ANGAN